MFILSLTYVAPLTEVEVHIAPHMDWVARGYDQGMFLASGRKQPRTGGIILAQGDRQALEALVATDPFVIAGVATYDITEIVLSRVVPGLEGLQP